MGILSWLGLEPECEKDPVELDDSNFRKEVLKSEVPVVVDVWSDGCMPCRALVPTIRKLACKYEGKVKVAQLNVQRGLQAVSSLGVSGTPTVLFFKDGREVERVVGIRGQHYFEEIIETDLLGRSPEEGAPLAD
jgi:thioredoxin 1